MEFDLYAWKAPRDLDPDEAAALVRTWQAAGGDPAASPFEPSTDVGWFYRELMKDDLPGLEAVSDGAPDSSRLPIWLQTDDALPARVVALKLSPSTAPDALDSIFGLAAKSDLVLFDPQVPRVRLPLNEMAAYASATFWPRGAIQAAVAGTVGAVIAVAAWVLGIPIVSGIAIVVGLFLAVVAVYTFVHEGQRSMRRRREQGSKPPP